ncbi:tetratricopeptide repeat protein [Saccharopolyspora sp. CA-218241]|uniref:tetratricopeptide repeat protein n=1 Tax=Saccharopolyspora sp. CA-218241 TaxID=3240027 RepID=UPI003D988F15
MTTDATLEAFRRAEDLVARRRPWEALRALEPVLDIAEDKPSVQLLLGRAYFFSAQLRRAENAFLRVLDADPTDHYARLVLGRTLQRQGRIKEARAQIKMAATMYPDPAYQEALGEINAYLATHPEAS